GANGNYALQAAIAACHVRALHAQDTDWARIASLYARLAAVAPSPIVELNRAVAVSMAEGPEADCNWWMRCKRNVRWPVTTCCRAYAVTCCSSWAATTRQGRNSNAPHRGPSTH